MYAFDYRINIVKYFMIPKSYDVVAQRFQIAGPFCILSGMIGMLTAVCLNNQLRFEADKIHDVRFDDFLSSELTSAELIAGQILP